MTLVHSNKEGSILDYVTYSLTKGNDKFTVTDYPDRIKLVHGFLSEINLKLRIFEEINSNGTHLKLHVFPGVDSNKISALLLFLKHYSYYFESGYTIVEAIEEALRQEPIYGEFVHFCIRIYLNNFLVKSIKSKSRVFHKEDNEGFDTRGYMLEAHNLLSFYEKSLRGFFGLTNKTRKTKLEKAKALASELQETVNLNLLCIQDLNAIEEQINEIIARFEKDLESHDYRQSYLHYLATFISIELLLEQRQEIKNTISTLRTKTNDLVRDFRFSLS